jgi:HSP20 family molecular chaperone IbpA
MENRKSKGKDQNILKSSGHCLKQAPIFLPNVDIFETEDNIIISADIPGVDEHDVIVTIEENELKIGGTVSYKPPGDYVLSEYTVGNFLRSFILSNKIDQEKIVSSLKNGVLRLTLPKIEATQPKKIIIQS